MKTYLLRDLAVTSFVATIQVTPEHCSRVPGGVCIYCKENNPIKRRKDLQILEESVATKITFGRKKSVFHRIIPPSTPS